MIKKPKVIVIVGPTGSGKTDLALRIAKKINGELIAADSRTVYRGLDIGTAKSRVPHHLIDIREPDESYSVAEFKADAERLIREITARGRHPIIVGGTGLYIQALVDNLTLPALPAQPKLRESFGQKPLPELLALLESLDPDAAAIVDCKNKRRVIRALEVCIFTGQSFSAQRTKGEPRLDILQLGIQRARTALYRRIDARIRAMFRAGLVAEVRRLVERYGSDIEPLRGIIYREVVQWLQQPERRRVTVRELAQLIMYANHRYARHQLMWFKRDRRIYWVRNPQQAERCLRIFLAASQR